MKDNGGNFLEALDALINQHGFLGIELEADSIYRME